MPTTAWSVARLESQREFGAIEFATTTDLTTSTAVVSTELADDQDQDDYFIGWYVIIRGTNNALVVRRITDYAASTGTLTVAGANLAADSGAVTCELHKFHPERVRDAYNRVRQDIFPYVAITRDHQTIVTGQLQQKYTLPSSLRRGPTLVYLGKRYQAADLAVNLLLNAGFEAWTSATAVTSWTVNGASATVNQEEETTSPRNYMVLEGANSARLHAPASTTTQLYQRVTPTVGTQGVEVNASVWVYCNTSGRVSVAVEDQNGTSSGTTGGTQHSGTGWERLTAIRNMSFDTDTIGLIIEISSGTPALDIFIDEAMLIVGQEEPIDKGWEIAHNWRWIPPVAGASDGGSLEFIGQPPEKRRIRILCYDMLSSVTSDTDTFEVDGELLQILYDEIRRYLAHERAMSGPLDDRDLWMGFAREYERRVSRAINTNGTHPFVGKKIRIPDAPL